MRIAVTLAFTLAAGVLASSAVAGDYYRWKDDSGVVHYDPKPPKDHPSTLVHLSGKVPESPPAAEPAKDEPPLTDTQAKIKAANDAINADNCKQASTYVSYYEDKGPLRTQAPDGTIHTMTPEERQAGYQEALRKRDEYCNKK